MNNSLYRNNPPYVNFNLYERRNTLRKNEIEKLLSQLRRYRNEYGLSSSRVVQNTIQNLENNMLKKSKTHGYSLRENILKAKSRLRRVRAPVYKKAPFSASNLKRVVLRSVSPKKNKTLAHKALNKLLKQGRTSNVPWNVLPSGSMRRGITTPKHGITRANVRVGHTNINTVKNFKKYINLMKNELNYSNSNHSSENINRMFRNSFAHYRNKYGLTLLQEKKLKAAIRKIIMYQDYKNPFLSKMYTKYSKHGFLNAKNIGKLMILVKK